MAFADETEKVTIVVNYQLPQCIWPIKLWLSDHGDAHALIWSIMIIEIYFSTFTTQLQGSMEDVSNILVPWIEFVSSSHKNMKKISSIQQNAQGVLSLLASTLINVLRKSQFLEFFLKNLELWCSNTPDRQQQSLIYVILHLNDIITCTCTTCTDFVQSWIKILRLFSQKNM